MQRKTIKNFIIPTMYILVIVISFFSATVLHNFLTKTDENHDYSKSLMKDVTQTVISDVEDSKEVIIKPYANGNVEKIIGYYDKDMEKEEQTKSLIYYEQTYMPSTGIIYGANEEFEVICPLSGTVENIGEDNILGTYVQIKHDNNISTYYYSLKDLKVKVGDKIETSQAIGTATTNKINSEKCNFLFEVYNEGKLINPEKFYVMHTNELQ